LSCFLGHKLDVRALPTHTTNLTVPLVLDMICICI